MSASLPPKSDRRSGSKVGTLVRGGVLLVLLLAIAAGLLSVYVTRQVGSEGIGSVVLAFAVCVVAGLAAYALAVFTVGTPNAMPGMMGGMLFRTGLPIVAGVVGTNVSSQLNAAGFMGHCLVLFLVGLICEVWLNIRLIQSADRKRAEQQSSREAGNHIATVL